MKTERSRNPYAGLILSNVEAKIAPECDYIKYTNNDSRIFIFPPPFFFSPILVKKTSSLTQWFSSPAGSDDKSSVPWKLWKEKVYF